MQVDNITAVGFSNDTIKQKHPKSINMRFYWIRDHNRQDHLKITGTLEAPNSATNTPNATPYAIIT